MPKRSIFVSHISAESELAQALKKHLTRDFLGSFEVFVSSDGRTIKAGSNWLDELSGGLRQAMALFVLCSEEAVKRPWVNFEAGGGWVRGIPVIPLCHSGMTPETLPIPLKLLQAVELGRAEGLRGLYEVAAERLGMQAPAADFQAMAAEFRELETRYRQARQAAELIENPRILCAASRQYSMPDYQFELDIEVLNASFPGQAVVRRDITSGELRTLLATERFDIVHLVLPIDRANGDLLFSAVDDAGQPIDRRPDRMRAEAFAGLLAEARTRLVVLATCRALLLAVRVAHVANMIAADDEITGEEAAAWGRIFYGLLARGFPLFKAFDLTQQDSGTPMLLVRQKDVAFAARANRP